MKEREYLQRLSLKAEENIEFFSSKMKPERERSACAAFLRCLGIKFKINEIESCKDEPPDVIFRSGRFEIREILDKDRKRNDEFKKAVEKYKKAEKIDELSEPYYPPQPITFKDVVTLIEESLEEKAQKYSKDVIRELDILVYVDLKTKFLKLDTPLFNLEKLISQGWRSVSMVMPPYSLIFFAKKDAPEFLCQLQGQTRNEWGNFFDTLFDLKNFD